MSEVFEVVQEEGEVIGCHTVDAWKAQFQKGLESKKLVVVDFTASWYPPCRFIAPFFAELAKNNTGVIFLKVDVDELQSVAKEWDVEAMPTFVFIKEGKVLERIVGADKDGLQRAIEKHTTADTADASATPTFVVKEGKVSEETEGADQEKHTTADTADA